ncbi:MAG: hypothetical protein H8K07_05430 [Nitrospira sp.]|nr:hypothetical protein [Nitrospira sp.]
MAYGGTPMLGTRDLLTESRPASVDAFSYHHYMVRVRAVLGDGDTDHGRSGTVGAVAQAHDETLAYDKKLRDEFRPDKPFWLTETADAVCGGNPWARSFLTVRSALP